MKYGIFCIFLIVFFIFSCPNTAENQGDEFQDTNIFVEEFQYATLPNALYTDMSDSMIYQYNSETNFGTTATLYAGYNNSTAGSYFSLIYFNLNMIPNQAKIKNAYLILNASAIIGPVFTVNLYKVQNYTWSEGAITYTTWSAMTDTIGEHAGSFQIVPGTTKYSINIKASTVQSWINSNFVNEGLFMRASFDTSSVNNYAIFFSKDSGTNYKPILVIYYTLD